MSMHGLQSRMDKLEAQQKGSGLHTVTLHNDGTCTNQETGEEYPNKEAAAQALQDGKLIVFVREFGELWDDPQKAEEEARNLGVISGFEYIRAGIDRLRARTETNNTMIGANSNA